MELHALPGGAPETIGGIYYKTKTKDLYPVTGSSVTEAVNFGAEYRNDLDTAPSSDIRSGFYQRFLQLQL